MAKKKKEEQLNKKKRFLVYILRDIRWKNMKRSGKKVFQGLHLISNWMKKQEERRYMMEPEKS